MNPLPFLRRELRKKPPKKSLQPRKKVNRKLKNIKRRRSRSQTEKRRVRPSLNPKS